MSEETKKICFVVTPIGGKDTPIRRHIEGIIDHAIIPALESKYEVEVAHRKYEIGSINDRIINSIYSADLVIANLTTLNPNVMFELAIRYSFGKPAIVIAEHGTQLPFDIIDENTIFYDNDPMGANILKEQLIMFENSIVFDNKKCGPVYRALNVVALYKDIESGEAVSSEKMLQYIINKFDVLENSLKTYSISLKAGANIISISFAYDGDYNLDLLSQEIDKFASYNEKYIRSRTIYNRSVYITCRTLIGKQLEDRLRKDIDLVMQKCGLEHYSVDFYYDKTFAGED